MSMLLGAAKLLKEREADIKGTVLLVFQPAEEGGAGARLRFCVFCLLRALPPSINLPSPSKRTHPPEQYPNNNANTKTQQ